MKILGIGVDFIENKRIRKSMKNKRCIQRIFSRLELNIPKKERIKNNFYAKRFAAKESFAKALGTGIRKELFFRDIIIMSYNLLQDSMIIHSNSNDIRIIYNLLQLNNPRPLHLDFDYTIK